MNRSLDLNMNHMKFTPILTRHVLREFLTAEIREIESRADQWVTVNVSNDYRNRACDVEVTMMSGGVVTHVNAIKLNHMDRPDQQLRKFAETVKGQLQLML